jgi:hypothetical protein
VFIHFCLAAGAWSVLALWHRRSTVRGFAGDAVRLHAVPLIAGTLIYLLFVRGIAVGGGVGEGGDQSVIEVFASAFGWVLAPPYGDRWMLAAAACGVALLALGLSHVRRHEGDAVVLYAGATVVAPLLVIIMWPVAPYVRYFIVPLLFTLLLVARLLARLSTRGRHGMFAYCAAMLALLALNGAQFAELRRVGRGQRSEALAVMDRYSTQPRITVASNHDLRVSLELDFFAATYLPGREVFYVESSQLPEQGAEWLVVQLEPFNRVTPLPALRDARGTAYRLVIAFPTNRLSGLQWLLYHNDAWRRGARTSAPPITGN